MDLLVAALGAHAKTCRTGHTGSAYAAAGSASAALPLSTPSAGSCSITSWHDGVLLPVVKMLLFSIIVRRSSVLPFF
jgi:hypothetical protein